MLESCESARLDQWLWATRLFKTRALAAEACKNSRVEVNSQRGKPSRNVKVGDRIRVERGILTQEVEVRALLTKRVGAKRVLEYLIDHTPEEAYEKAREVRRNARLSAPDRKPGAGRPTKKERRELDGVRGEDFGHFWDAFDDFFESLSGKEE